MQGGTILRNELAPDFVLRKIKKNKSYTYKYVYFAKIAKGKDYDNFLQEEASPLPHDLLFAIGTIRLEKNLFLVLVFPQVHITTFRNP